MQNEQLDFWVPPLVTTQKKEQLDAQVRGWHVPIPPPMSSQELERLYRQLEPDVPY